MKTYRLFTAIMILSTLMSCNDNDDNTSNDKNICEPEIIVSEEAFNNAPNSGHSINELQLEGDCLTIDFSASGCGGDTWEIKLVASPIVIETFPIQQFIRLSLKNEEVCRAVIRKSVTFDISKLKETSPEPSFINFVGYNDKVFYQ